MIEVKFEGLDSLNSKLGALFDALENDVAAFQADAKSLTAFYEKEFSSGGFPSWADVQPMTRKRRRVNPAAPPLTDSGGLSRVVASMAGYYSEWVRSESTVIAAGMLIHSISGPDVHTHEAGYGNIPARPFFDVFESGYIESQAPMIFENHSAWLNSVIAGLDF